jgi:hypothetical protein
MPSLPICLLLQFFATAALVGLIWTVQLAIYPRFRDFPTDGFIGYHFRYCRGIGLIVAPLFLLELLTGLAWWWLLPTSQAAQFGMILIVVNLFSTASLQAPLHVKLMRGRDERTIKLLVLTNWIRTITWTTRAAIVGFALASIIQR